MFFIGGFFFLPYFNSRTSQIACSNLELSFAVSSLGRLIPLPAWRARRLQLEGQCAIRMLHCQTLTRASIASDLCHGALACTRMSWIYPILLDFDIIADH